MDYTNDLMSGKFFCDTTTYYRSCEQAGKATKSMLSLFESDSSQVRTIILDDESNIRANIYRRTTRHLEYDFEWAMWKWIKMKNDQLKFETEELMNKHLFE